MRLKRITLLLFSILYTTFSFAQIQGELVQSRILILLDESSSMIQEWSGTKPKYKAADELIMRLMDSVYAVNNNVEFSLRVFGHQHTVGENDCYDTKNEVAFSRDNRSQMSLRLDDIRPLGVTPIAFALKEAAAKDIIDEAHNVYSIILITDGGESCGGDICDVMKTLLKNKVYFKPYIVSLENDPTLKTTYSCMGDFLQVTRQADMAGAVSTIVQAFRPVLKVSTDEYKHMQTIAASAPSVLKVSVPVINVPEKKDTAVVVKPKPVEVPKPVEQPKPAMKTWKTPEPEHIASMEATGVRLLRHSKRSPDKMEEVISNLRAPVITYEAPPPPTPEKINTIAATNVRPLPISAPEPGSMKKIASGLKLPAMIIDTPVARVPDKMVKIKTAPLKTFVNIYVIDEHPYTTKRVPPLPAIKSDWLPKPDPSTAKSGNYTQKTEDAKETSVEVLFTNGNGVFYSSTPQVLLTDPVTKKLVKKFFRTVDADGNPDPQTNIPAGTYDLTLAAKSHFKLGGVKIELNKKNIITVVVETTSLSFAYENAPDRPVTEFTAVVTERNKARGRVQDQKCSEALKYEPGNYHIEINTFPKEIRNEDIDFDGEFVITIKQPGFVNFVSDGSAHVVSLFQRYGDKFLAFYTLDLNDPRSKNLRMQPGEYQAHYQKGPGQNSVMEQVKQFVVKPTQTTEVILN